MFGLGPTELILIFVVILLFFGVRKLPEIGSGLGEGIKNFRKSLRDEEKKLESGKDSESKDVSEKKTETDK